MNDPTRKIAMIAIVNSSLRRRSGVRKARANALSTYPPGPPRRVLVSPVARRGAAWRLTGGLPVRRRADSDVGPAGGPDHERRTGLPPPSRDPVLAGPPPYRDPGCT